MPLHDVGYRRWNGTQSGFSSRWFAITNKGFEIALRSHWVKRMMFLAWLPAIYFGIAFFLFEKFVESSAVLQRTQTVNEMTDSIKLALEENGITTPEEVNITQQRINEQVIQRSPLGWFVRNLGGDGSQRVLKALINSDDAARRRTVWSWLLLQFLSAPQGVALLLLIGWVAPALIAKDMRTKAFLLYFSRPLSKLSYIIGKLMILVVLASFITTIPACLLYFVGVGFSPDLNVLYETWDLPFRIFAVSMLHIVPTSLLALMFSSMTSESRYAMFAWYATWILGFVAWWLLKLAILFRENQTAGDLSLPLEQGGAWMYLSLYDTIASAQAFAMGVSDDSAKSMPAFVILILIGVFSFLMIWRRISKAVLV